MASDKWYFGKFLENRLHPIMDLVFGPLATVAPADAKIGLGGHCPSSTSNLQALIDKMGSLSSNVYRMAFSPQWAANNYKASMVQYFLDHAPSGWVILVDRNHTYPSNETQAAGFRANLGTARANILDICRTWPNNPRVWPELGNEYVSSDFHTIFQGLINDVRNAGYNNTLVIDKWNTSWTTARFTDPYDKVFTGMHFYFNSWGVASAETQMQTGLSNGLKLINTEIGADWHEGSSFTDSTVAEVNSFLSWCKSKGISNCLWMNHNLDNMSYYESHRLAMPKAGTVGGTYVLGLMGNIDGIPFNITNVGSYKTDAYPRLSPGSYQIVMPSSATVGGKTYYFRYWGRTGTGSTNPVRTVTLGTANTYFDVTYG